MAPFPVGGLAFFSHDWGFPRYNPYPHLHEGTDIFADEGTPLIAPAPGTLKGFGNQGVGGLSVWIELDDGTGLYYTHMSGFAPGIQVGQRVIGGTLVGFIGSTGNAAGSSPHVHFEIHPPIRDRKGRIVSGGVTTQANGQGSNTAPPVDPKPYLDEWLRQAEDNARAFAAGVLQQYAEIPREAHISRRVNDLFSVEPVDRPGDMLWFSSSQPVLGALGLARQAAIEARLSGGAGSIQQRTTEQARMAAVRQAVQAPTFQMETFTGVPALDQPARPTRAA
ncbi:MAG: M23 family metallopeptidase [Actinomycetota bacterium]